MMEQERQGYTQILPSSRAMRSGWFTNYPYGSVRASLTPCFQLMKISLSCPDFSVLSKRLGELEIKVHGTKRKRWMMTSMP